MKKGIEKVVQELINKQKELELIIKNKRERLEFYSNRLRLIFTQKQKNEILQLKNEIKELNIIYDEVNIQIYKIYKNNQNYGTN